MTSDFSTRSEILPQKKKEKKKIKTGVSGQVTEDDAQSQVPASFWIVRKKGNRGSHWRTSSEILRLLPVKTQPHNAPPMAKLKRTAKG